MADDYSKGYYANAAAMRRKYALHLLQQASDASPVKHPLQALARAIQGGLGGYYAGQLEREQLANAGGAGAGSATAAVPLPRPRPSTAPMAEQTASSPAAVTHASSPVVQPMAPMSPTSWQPPFGAPPQDAIDLLKRRPELRTEFDSKYGEGAAARAFGGE